MVREDPGQNSVSRAVPVILVKASDRLTDQIWSWYRKGRCAHRDYPLWNVASEYGNLGGG